MKHYALFHQAHQVPVGVLHLCPGFFFARRRRLLEREGAVVTLAVHAVHEKQVCMYVEIQAPAKAVPHMDARATRSIPATAVHNAVRALVCRGAFRRHCHGA